MKTIPFLWLTLLTVATIGCGDRSRLAGPPDPAIPSRRAAGGDALPAAGDDPPAPARAAASDPPRPIAPFVARGLEWLVEAQHPDGGWGAGSHSEQTMRDPHAVATDPATTAFAAMALVRAGHTPGDGAHRGAVRRATLHLVQTVEAAPEEGPRITDRTNTQPQAKLGPLVDTAMVARYLSRLLPALDGEPELRTRVDAALDRCLRKLGRAQAEDGSFHVAGGGWAPVLQSTLAYGAIELAQAAGKEVDGGVFAKARRYQQGLANAATGEARSDAAAGVELYAFAASQRGNAGDAYAARELLRQAKEDGRVAAEALPTRDMWKGLGMDDEKASRLERAHQLKAAQDGRLRDEALLAGFGNNGGEEYLSYMLTSESLVLDGDDEWQQWDARLHERVAKVQNPDGSWTGHHCITSPVFCTAAVLQSLTVDREAELLRKAQQAALAEAR